MNERIEGWRPPNPPEKREFKIHPDLLKRLDEIAPQFKATPSAIVEDALLELLPRLEPCPVHGKHRVQFTSSDIDAKLFEQGCNCKMRRPR